MALRGYKRPITAGLRKLLRVEIYAGLFTIVLILLNITACVTTELPANPEPLCEPVPMVTGEKFIFPVLETPPPIQVHREQSTTIQFSGGFYFSNNGINCQDEVGSARDGYIGYVHSDQLAWVAHEETTNVRLSGSDEVCEIEFIVPPDKPYYRVLCDEERVVGYLMQDTLAESPYRRAVKVLLDEEELTSIECHYTCRIPFIIPADVSVGTHKLELEPGIIYLGENEEGKMMILLSPAYLEGLAFDIEVIEDNQ